jgi:hypothetical protein
MERVKEKDVQFDTICKLHKDIMWSEKLGEENLLEMASEKEALNMRVRILEEAAKRDQTQINALEVESDSYKRQLGASVNLRLSEKDAAAKQEMLIESLHAEISLLRIQLGDSAKRSSAKTHFVANHGSLS